MVYLEGIHGAVLFAGDKTEGLRLLTRTRLFRSGGDSLRMEMLFFLCPSLIEELLELAHEFVDILELSIH